MYAIVEEGGRQYQVSVGQTIKVNRLAAKQGDEFVFGKVLLVKDASGVKAGPDLLAGVSVTGRVTRLERGPKILVFKKKRRKGYHKSQGHRQDLSAVLITAIGGVVEPAPGPVPEDEPAPGVAPADESASAPESESSPEAAQAETVASTEESVQPDGDAPADEAAPAEETAPSEENAPNDEAAPADESDPKDDTAPAE
ncbi:MAG: 50S ribosomal protein L21 [Deltaproteobacteria bacterium]|jgi:large subunit ribosomal protein L21|nr:50S ribosomal protein L21 [Deltaproteobacteria bacterium]